MKCKQARNLLATCKVKRIEFNCIGKTRVDYGDGWIYTPVFFGAVPDGVTDCTEAFKKLFDFNQGE